MTTVINLPEDLVVEILSRVPAVSLLQLRSTCKRWNDLIGDGKFAKKHSTKAPKYSLVILVINYRVHLVNADLRGFHENIAPSMKLACQFSLKDPLEEEVNIGKVFHCDGLLLCITEDRRMVVWNPCSGETRWIQLRNPYLEHGCYALGKSSCNKYKILSTKSNNEYEICEITSNLWRDVSVTTGLLPHGRGIYVNENAYWLDAYNDQELLLSFNFSTEKFQSVPLPENYIFHSVVAFTVSMNREGQQLCMLATHVETDVWMANKCESTGAMSWNKFITVARSDFPYRCQFSDGMSFLVYEENKVILLSCNYPYHFKNNIIHIMGEDKYIQVDHLGVEHKEESWIPVLHSYVPSLAQIQSSFERRSKGKFQVHGL